jgi:hypothetical protein
VCDISLGRELLNMLRQILHHFLSIGMRPLVNGADADRVNPAGHHHKIGVILLAVNLITLAMLFFPVANR